MSDPWQQIEELYHAAREDRAALDKADPELRREVESLLAQEKGVDFLDSPALEVVARKLAGQDLIGRWIGTYEILSLLGAGGMGEVYRARDTKLKREVALKVLPEAFAGDPARMARFQREAELLASLNHPNIAQIYGVEDRALVMELVPGKTLKGPLPVETALDYAQQIADALEAAHDKGIAHRDLKPSNIMITPAGVVKVLDFGLAAQSHEHDEGETLTMPATRSGTILGTAAYMSPEQARGGPVDKRTDIWAFGAVLYEVLTGKQAFGGETASDTLASVLKDEPVWERVPQRAQRLLRRCLEKDPKRRLRDIADAMELVGEEPPGTALRHSKLPWAVAAAAVLLAAAGWWYATRPAPLRPLVRLDAEIAAGVPLVSADGNPLALSPDGTRLAFTLRGPDGKVRLHSRLLQQNQFVPLNGTENAFSPFFSPDGEWIGFFADGKLKKISVEGGAAVTLCDAPIPDGGSWGDDGNIVMALNIAGRLDQVLSRVPSSAGTPVPVTRLKPGEVIHRWPQVLPGSQAVLFTAHTQIGNYDEANIDVVSLKTGVRKTVQRGGFFARYLATSNRGGHLLYLHQSTLFAVPFDPVRLALAGVPVPILEDVSNSPGSGGDFAFGGVPSGPGTFVYLAGKATRVGWRISWLDSAGKTQPLHAPMGRYLTLRFSPDGKRLAFATQSSSGEDIWVTDLDTDTPSRLSFLDGNNRWPVWTPDGKNIVFQSTNSASPGLYWIRSDGSGEAQRLTDGKLNEFPGSFSPDGKRLVLSQTSSRGTQDIFTAPIEGDAVHPRLGKPELFLATPFIKWYPRFSPDGRWLAYTSNEPGTFEVYVRPFPGPGGRWQISKGGGFNPQWSRDGRELLFGNLDQRVMAVGYSAKGDSFVAGKPRVWSEARLLNLGGIFLYDLAPDGKRLAAVLAEAGGEKPPTHLTFLLNFFDELRRRAPAGGK
jgi:Tol biopolymer transport system component/predicted Ser/Thr protein kinase